MKAEGEKSVEMNTNGRSIDALNASMIVEELSKLLDSSAHNCLRESAVSTPVPPLVPIFSNFILPLCLDVSVP